jgi:hypothetical protein
LFFGLDERRSSIAWQWDAKVSKVGEAIEFGESNLLNLYAKSIFQPLRREVAMTPFAASMAVVCRFPTE